MTRLEKPVVRRTATALDGCFGPDRGKAIVVRLVPGDGKSIPDLIELRPERTRRAEQIAVMDVYRYAMRCRVGRELLERARAKKAKLEAGRAQRRLDAAERRMRQRIKADQVTAADA
jgi:hypothetical protein